MAATQKNELFDPGFLFTPSDTFSLGRAVLPQYKTSQTDDNRQTTDRRDIVPKARPIVRSAKNRKIPQFWHLVCTHTWCSHRTKTQCTQNSGKTGDKYRRLPLANAMTVRPTDSSDVSQVAFCSFVFGSLLSTHVSGRLFVAEKPRDASYYSKIS